MSSHGFALNVSTHLRYFEGIVPCGLYDRQMTSMERETERSVDITHVQSTVAGSLANHLGLAIEEEPQQVSEIRALLTGAVAPC